MQFFKEVVGISRSCPLNSNSKKMEVLNLPKIKKAYAISDAKISFVSLVDKAANRKKFLIA